MTYNSGTENKLSRYLLLDDEENAHHILARLRKDEFHPLDSGYWDALKTEPRFRAVADKLNAVCES
jgi:hypothetical protein